MALGVQVDMATPSRQVELPSKKYLKPALQGTNVCSIAVSEPTQALTLLALELENIRDGDQW